MIDKYIKMRNANQFDMQWFYNYFKEKGGKATPEQFQTVFHNVKEKTTVDGRDFEYLSARNFKSFVEAFDKKLGLTTIFDKEGKFVKVY